MKDYKKGQVYKIDEDIFEIISEPDPNGWVRYEYLYTTETYFNSEDWRSTEHYFQEDSPKDKGCILQPPSLAIIDD